MKNLIFLFGFQINWCSIDNQSHFTIAHPDFQDIRQSDFNKLSGSIRKNLLDFIIDDKKDVERFKTRICRTLTCSKFVALIVYY